MTKVWRRELAGIGAAALIATATVAQIASTARAELLFRDGDSLIVPMVIRSLADGQPFEWALSTVLFLPEIAVFGLLWLIASPLGINTLLLINAVLNLLGLYGALRLVAGRQRAGRAPVVWAVIALLVYCGIAMTDASASRDALELASLLTTTSYYSATVIAVVFSVGLLRRALEGQQRGRLLPFWLAVVAGISTLSNPLYAAWATVPLGAMLAVAALYRPTRPRMISLLCWLIGGTVVGVLARIPLSAFIANNGTGYAQPTLWPDSVRYYGALIGDRLDSPLGLIGLALPLVLLGVAVRLSFRVDDPGARFVAVAAWFAPLAVLIGAVGLGTHAARYLEPVAFMPVLALVAHPRAFAMSRRMVRQLAGISTVILLLAGGLSVPRAATAATAPDADLQCATQWINASGKTGAGQFWTVRLPKLHLANPAQLVQVDHQLYGYAWLVNRYDFRAPEVSFVIEDEQSTPWQFAESAVPTDVIGCGRYTIFDFEPEELRIGPPHS